jgi:hypothetical protein
VIDAIPPSSAAMLTAMQLPSAVPPSLPPALIVQLLEIPKNFPPPAQPLLLPAQLSLLDLGKILAETEAGTFLLSLPQLRQNPALQESLRALLDMGQRPQLRLQTNAAGALEARLVLSAPVADQGNVKDVVTAPVNPLQGKIVQAVILPTLANPTPLTAAQINPKPTNETARTSPSVATSAGGQSGPYQAALNPAASVIQIQIQQLLAPQQTPPILQAGQQLAIVSEEGGILNQPIISNGKNSFLLKTNQPMTAGTQVVFRILENSESALATKILENPAASSGLQELLNLASSAPALQKFAQLRLPQSNAHLGGALLFLLSAMQQGDAAVWLGRQATQSLSTAERLPLLETLQREMREQRQNVTDAIVGDWRHYQLPLLDQGQLQALQLYVHHNDPDARRHQTDQETKQNKQTRFVIDVTFTRLGAMQLDGFVQKTQFDLILRSQKTLSEELRQELRDAFGNAITAAGYHGQMQFQTGTQNNWLKFSRV